MKAFNRGCPIRREEDCDGCPFYDAVNNLCDYDRNLSYDRNIKDAEMIADKENKYV